MDYDYGYLRWNVMMKSPISINAWAILIHTMRPKSFITYDECMNDDDHRRCKERDCRCMHIRNVKDTWLRPQDKLMKALYFWGHIKLTTQPNRWAGGIIKVVLPLYSLWHPNTWWVLWLGCNDTSITTNGVESQLNLHKINCRWVLSLGN